MRPFALVLLLALIAPLAMAATDTPFAKRAEYSADLSYVIGEMKGSGKVYQGKTADRREMSVHGQETVMIKKDEAIFMLMPKMGVAMKMALGSDPLSEALDPDPDQEFEAVGKAVIDGEKTTKYRAKYEGGEGYFWATEDGIVMRVEAETKEGKLVFNTTNVKRGPQPESLSQPGAPRSMAPHRSALRILVVDAAG